MRKEYNFSNARKNTYVSKDIEQITITLDFKIINYFKYEAIKTGIPYQVLITSYLKDCVKKKRELEMN
jgi:predicted DNA binding CopG/RHH family protein